MNKVFSQSPFIKHKGNVKSLQELAFDFFQNIFGKPLGLEAFVINDRSSFKSACPTAITDNLQNLVFIVSQSFKSRRNTLIDNFEISSPGQFFEFDQGKIRLDAGGVAIHDQP